MPQISVNHGMSIFQLPAIHASIRTAHGRPCSVVRKSELPLEVAAGDGLVMFPTAGSQQIQTVEGTLLILGKFILTEIAASWPDIEF